MNMPLSLTSPAYAERNCCTEGKFRLA